MPIIYGEDEHRKVKIKKGKTSIGSVTHDSYLEDAIKEFNYKIDKIIDIQGQKIARMQLKIIRGYFVNGIN